MRLFAQVGEGVGVSTRKCSRFSVGHHLPPRVYFHITANGHLLPFCILGLCGSVDIYTGKEYYSRFSVGHPRRVFTFTSMAFSLHTASMKNWMWSGSKVKSLGY